jgi:uncharacterized protein (TIGR02271 family)
MNEHYSNSQTEPIREIPTAQTQLPNEGTPDSVVPDGPRPPERVVVQLRQEQLLPVKEWVEAGAILVQKGVETHPQTIPVEVLREEVDIQRVPVNQPLAEGTVANPWHDGDTLVIPIVHEELVVTKRLVVREEMRITKRRVAGVQEVSDTLRHETINLATTGKAQVQPPDTNNG